ncbi:glycosyltransferase family 4 protein [bacterium]|nr:glycosyltransferase family 4 protein [bacterium]
MLAYTFYEGDARVIQYANALVSRGDDVDVFALRRNGLSYCETVHGVKLYRIQTRTVNEKGRISYLLKVMRFFINSAFLLTKEHLRNPYDLVHVHSVPDFEVFAAWLPKIVGTKVILDIHDIVPEFYASKFKTNRNSVVYKLLLLVEKASTAFSDHVIIANHIWQKKLVDRSVPKKKCTAILNYPDTTMFYKRLRKRKDNKFLMIYPGTLNRHQGTDIAIKALALIRGKAPQAELHIYGRGGSEKDSLVSLVTELGLEDRVFLKGFLPIEEIAGVMGNAGLGIVPKRADSFGNEAFSTKTLQFMALGIPVIVSNTKIDRYYFDESVVTFFQSGDEKDLAKCMLSLIRDDQLRDRFAANASKYVEQNSWDVKKQIYLDLVDSLVGSTGTGKRIAHS